MLKHGLIADKAHWDQLIQIHKLEVKRNSAYSDLDEY
jgi:3-dehydroquinate synthase